MTSTNITMFACRHFFMIAISFLIFSSVLDTFAVRGVWSDAGNVDCCRRNSLILLARGLLRLTTLMAWMMRSKESGVKEKES